MSRCKFDDCVDCRFRKKPAICAECDYGEQFEDREMEELNFDGDRAFRQSDKLLVTDDDDEPNFSPDDMIRRLGEDNEEEEHDEDE